MCEEATIHAVKTATIHAVKTGFMEEGWNLPHSIHKV